MLCTVGSREEPERDRTCWLPVKPLWIAASPWVTVRNSFARATTSAASRYRITLRPLIDEAVKYGDEQIRRLEVPPPTLFH
jgi:hypothetical protein